LKFEKPLAAALSHLWLLILMLNFKELLASFDARQWFQLQV